jgi:hypothetical protein
VRALTPKALIFDINLLPLLIMSNQICRKGNNSYIVSLNILYGRMQPVKVVSDCPFRPKNQWQDNSIIMCYKQCFQCNIDKDASEWLYFSL